MADGERWKQAETEIAMDDPYDSLIDRCLIDGARIAPRWQVFASGAPNGWRVGETDNIGELLTVLRDNVALYKAMKIVRRLRQAEALEGIGTKDEDDSFDRWLGGM